MFYNQTYQIYAVSLCTFLVHPCFVKSVGMLKSPKILHLHVHLRSTSLSHH